MSCARGRQAGVTLHSAACHASGAAPAAGLAGAGARSQAWGRAGRTACPRRAADGRLPSQGTCLQCPCGSALPPAGCCPRSPALAASCGAPTSFGAVFAARPLFDPPPSHIPLLLHSHDLIHLPSRLKGADSNLPVMQLVPRRRRTILVQCLHTHAGTEYVLPKAVVVPALHMKGS